MHEFGVISEDFGISDGFGKSFQHPFVSVLNLLVGGMMYKINHGFEEFVLGFVKGREECLEVIYPSGSANELMLLASLNDWIPMVRSHSTDSKLPLCFNDWKAVLRSHFSW